MSIVSFAVTFGTLLYKFGRLEGKITQQLQEHENRLNAIDRPGVGIHAGV